MKIIKYMDYDYYIIENNEKCPTDNLKDHNNIYIKIVYDTVFRSEFDTGIIKYKNYVKVLGIGYEINIYNFNYVVYRITTYDNLIRQVYEILPLVTSIFHKRNTAIIHGSGIIIGDEGFLCIGDSGAGKTTISNMAYTEGLKILSDELIIYDFDTNNIWGTSISSDDYLGKTILNKNVKLKRILLLNKSNEWDIKPIKKSAKKIIEIFNNYRLNQFSIKYIQNIYSKVEVCNLYFNKEIFQDEVIKSNV